MKFSLFLPQGATAELGGFREPIEAYENLTRVAQVAEEGGFDALMLADVLWSGDFGGSLEASQAFLFECWTTAAAVARDTRHIRIGQMVTSNVFRQPALLAKMASTVDVLSHGRLTLGIGSGSPMLATQARAYGYDYPDAPILVAQLREAVQVLLAMWTQDEATFEGKYYQVHRAINQPKGVQKPHIPLLIAGGGEKATLKLVAQYGDACNVHGGPEVLRKKFEVLKQHCEAIGRDYNSINRTSGNYCILEDTDEQAMAKFPASARAAFGDTALVGSASTIRERINRFEDAGVQELVLRFPDSPGPAAIQRFVDHIMH